MFNELTFELDTSRGRVNRRIGRSDITVNAFGKQSPFSLQISCLIPCLSKFGSLCYIDHSLDVQSRACGGGKGVLSLSDLLGTET